MGQLTAVGEHSTKQVGSLIHDLLICMEMSVAAIGFLHSFSTTDFLSKPVTSISVPSLECHESETNDKSEDIALISRTLYVSSPSKDAKQKSSSEHMNDSEMTEPLIVIDAVVYIFTQSELFTDLKEVATHVSSISYIF